MIWGMLGWKNRQGQGVITFLAIILTTLVAVIKFGLSKGQTVMLSMVPVVVIQQVAPVLGKHYGLIQFGETMATVFGAIGQIGGFKVNMTDTTGLCEQLKGFAYAGWVMEGLILVIIIMQLWKELKKLKNKRSQIRRQVFRKSTTHGNIGS